MNNNVDAKYYEGHTNKKIVQAPGGSSSLSLAWSNQKTDYGPPRNYTKNAKKDQYQQKDDLYKPQNQPTYDQPNNYIRQDNANSLHYPPKYADYTYNKEQAYYKEQLTKDPNLGGKNYGVYYEQPQAIDKAVKVMQQQRRPPSQPKGEGKSCIRINGPPKQQFSIGDNNYNYWKDQGPENKGAINSSYQKIQNIELKKSPNNLIRGSSEDRQRTSVKVNNPPGGKSNFIFG